MTKKTPMLDPKSKNDQKIEDQNKQGDPNSKPESTEEPAKEDPDKVPESNDPVGYSESGNIKKSPYKKK